MTEFEAEELYRRLIHTLRAQRLDWLATQVEMEVVEGKMTPKLLTVFDQYEGDVALEGESFKGRSRRVEFAHAQEFAPKEKLGILIQAIRTIVVSSGKIFDELQKHSRLGEYENISFVSEADVADFQISRPQIEPLRRASEDLDRLLEKLDLEVAQDD